MRTSGGACDVQIVSCEADGLMSRLNENLRSDSARHPRSPTPELSENEAPLEAKMLRLYPVRLMDLCPDLMKI